ncbi:MAG: metallophosphoesterase family protein [Chitinophagales bacterium]
MKKILLLSDTHGFLDPALEKYIKAADEVWHAGDIGTNEVTDQLKKWNILRAVYGNIDGKELRLEFPKNQIFELEGVKIFMTHIGGYPSRYAPGILPQIEMHKPNIFICGHSHILKVMPDKKRHLIAMNPGAAGNYGFHKIKTCLRFQLNAGKIEKPEVIELGLRGQVK